MDKKLKSNHVGPFRVEKGEREEFVIESKRTGMQLSELFRHVWALYKDLIRKGL